MRRKLDVLLITVLVAIASTSSLHTAENPAFGNGLLLYFPFEGGVAPKFCLGSADVRTGAGLVGAGRVGSGFSVVGDASVSLPELGNFRRNRGTLAFWHRPHWNPDANNAPNVTLLRGPNFQLTWQSGKSILFFMTGTSKPGLGFHWDYSVSTRDLRAWKEQSWHHIAVTWDKSTGAKQLWLDGRLASQGKTEWIRDGEPELDERITIGDPTAPGDYDEWLVWDRVLSESEIVSLASDPETVAHALSNIKIPDEEEASPIRFDLVRLDADRTIVDPNEQFHLPVVARNVSEERVDVTLDLTLVDVWDKVIERRQERLDLKAAEERRLGFDLSSARNGVFKLRADLKWKGRESRADLGGFAVWPKGRLKPSRDSYFGNHINSWGNGVFLRQGARLGLSWQRNHDMMQATWWQWVQPEPGEPKWKLDFQLGFCTDAKMTVLGGLSTTPYWAADPPQPAPSGELKYPMWLRPRLDDFEKYVRLTVEHCRDRIHAWEIWNEPDTAVFWNGTPEEWALMTQRASKAAKVADPNCMVVAGAFTSAITKQWIDRAAKVGAFSCADAISFHGYAADTARFRTLANMVADVAVQHAPAGKQLELWNTEWGLRDTTFYVDGSFPKLPSRRLLPPASFLDGAAEVVKRDCIGMAMGIKRSFYYLQNDVKGAAAYSDMSMLEITRVPRSKLIARVALESLVQQAKPEAMFESAEHVLTSVVFSRANGTSLAAVWLNRKGDGELSAQLPAATEVLDLFANPIPQQKSQAVNVSNVPVYISAKVPAEKLIAILRESSATVSSYPRK